MRRLTAVAAVAGMLVLNACGGGGSGPVGNGGGGATTVTVSGKITFDRVPFKTARTPVLRAM